MKILAIGNSFSQDAVFYLKSIADSVGEKLEVVNLMIGGCSLKMHAENIEKHLEAYDYEVNGECAVKRTTITSALKEKNWDVVTVQQASHDSGLIETYEPYGTTVINCIKKNAPNAKIYFHMTWAYELDSTHSAFVRYDNSQQKMYEDILAATEQFGKNHGVDIIPTGTVIQALRASEPFDYSKNGVSLCRDGFHLSFTYGRFAAAATWYQKLVGDISLTSFSPEECDCLLINHIEKTIKRIVK